MLDRKTLVFVLACLVCLGAPFTVRAEPKLPTQVERLVPPRSSNGAPEALVWDSPSADCHGSMPLGNGDIGLNAWAQADGTLHLLIGKTDAWDDNARLVKIGKLVLQFEPDAFAPPFRQELDLATGSIVIQDRIRVWVDANHPVVRITTDLPATAAVEMWRTSRVELASLECSDIMLDRSKPDQKHAPMFVEPDVLARNDRDRITWFHHNARSVGPQVLAKLQGLTGFEQPDPILHRTFGASVVRAAHGFDIHVLTLHPATPEAWLAAMEERVRAAPPPDFDAHRRWWMDFWDRSWIRATRSANAPPAVASLAPANAHPFRVGSDQMGGNRWAGEIRNVRAPDDFSGAFTLEAEVKPAAGEMGRIFDKITPGSDDGFLLDAHPGHALRLICGTTQVSVSDALPAGRWAKIVATADPAAGGWRVTIDGQLVIDTAGAAFADDAAYVSRMYDLQRFITACAGRGAYPIKFNGSIFTVAPADGKGDHDFRRWGPGYWWQNTRLPYISLCTSGDLDLMQPLFKMYVDDLLPLCVYRTRHYFGHGGAYYPECIYFWGAVFAESYGWQPFEDRADKLQVRRWHKWEWVGGLELCWMLLDAWEHAPDGVFLESKVLPACREILGFFDGHYQTGPDGKLVMHPSQALETWWDCTNPMPEIAGCIAVCDRLLAVEGVPPADREFLRRFRAKLPELPLREVKGRQALAPAERFATKQNIENPELYAVFPFRLVALGKPNLAHGLEALEHRWDRGDFGWRQDDIFMAYLGLADEARRNLVSRARKHDKGSRFPAFWGPNYDWIPDQDHGGVLMKALQAMLIQTDGRTIRLLPAWPRDWNAEFKVHAPYRTTVEGSVVDGRLVGLKVTPESRQADVIVGGARP